MEPITVRSCLLRLEGLEILTSFSVTSTYQSNGLCYDHCEGDGYAFAIVQGSDCWCSNYVPGTTVDTSNCDTDCPGYPDDKCGNTDSNLYGYMTAGNKPSGTTGASTVSTTSIIPNTSTITETGPTTTLIIVRLLPSCIC
jgi:cell wall integrity and stress response component